MRLLTPGTQTDYARIFHDAAAARASIVHDGVTAALSYPDPRPLARSYKALERFVHKHEYWVQDREDIDEPRGVLLVSGPQNKFGMVRGSINDKKFPARVIPLSRNQAEKNFGTVMVTQAIKISSAFPEFDPIIWRIFYGDRGTIIGAPHLDNGVHRKGSYELMERLTREFGVATRMTHTRETGAMSATIAFGSLGTVLYPTTHNMLGFSDKGYVRGLFVHAQTEAPRGPCIAVKEGDACIMRAIAGWQDVPEKLPQVHAPYHHHFDDDPPMIPRGVRISAVDFSLVV